MFGSIVIGVFYLEIHQNNIIFLKKIFLTSTHQNDLKITKIY
jgi:hypothetical protein